MGDAASVWAASVKCGTRLQAGADVGLHGGAREVLLHLPRLPQQRRLGALLPPRPLLVQLLFRLKLRSERVSVSEQSKRLIVALPCRQRLPACVHDSCGPTHCLRISSVGYASNGMGKHWGSAP